MTAHPVDSVLYGHLWSTPEAHALLDDAARLRSWLEILAVLAEAQAAVGLIPAEAARQIREHADPDRLDIGEVARQTRQTGHSTLGLIRCLREILPAGAREWVYYGATVQDLSDTWMALVMREITGIALRDLRRARSAAAGLAREHRDTVLPGRTHGQPGLPVTFGFKAAVWAAELHRLIERLEQGRLRWETAQLGGALGTMEFWGDAALPLLAEFAERLGLAEPEIPWLTARDRVAEFGSVLAMITATLGKIGQEVYQLQRPEIGELRERFVPGQVGSITMPHKRNPELSEHLVTLARLAGTQAGTLIAGMIHEHERDGRAWKAEWLALPELCLLTCAALSFGGDLLDGLEVDATRMRENVASGGGYLMSEPVMRALAAKIGKHSAHELVYRAALAGRERGTGFRAALLAEPLIAAELSEAEIDRCLDPDAALGSAGAFTDRVLAICDGPGTR